MENTKNPYSTQPVTAPIRQDNNLDVSAQVRKFRDEEKLHKSPQVLPFSLDSSQELLSQIYEKLLMFRKSVLTASQDSQVNKKVLDEISKTIDNIGDEILIKIPSALDKLLR